MPLRIDNEDELREAQAALFNINSTSGWLLVNYVGPSTVHFAAGGEGDENEWKPLLEDDQIQYLLVRLGNIPEQNSVRDIFIKYIGFEVGIIEKGKKTAHLGDIQSLLQPFHADVTVVNKNALDRDSLLDRSHPLSGSHVID